MWRILLRFSKIEIKYIDENKSLPVKWQICTHLMIRTCTLECMPNWFLIQEINIFKSRVHSCFYIGVYIWSLFQYNSLSRYGVLHYKDKMVTRPSHLNNGNHHIWKDEIFILRWSIPGDTWNQFQWQRFIKIYMYDFSSLYDVNIRRYLEIPYTWYMIFYRDKNKWDKSYFQLHSNMMIMMMLINTLYLLNPLFFGVIRELNTMAVDQWSWYWLCRNKWY